METAEYFIEKLNMKPHPEGGFYSEFYRSTESIEGESLPERYSGDRSLGTSIFFMLRGDDFSTFHRLKSDEIWYFHTGSPIDLYTLDTSGKLKTTRMSYESEDSIQFLFPAGVWFAAAPVDKSSFSLVSCSVFPGFDFEDFEMADREVLTQSFPEHRELIHQFTRS